MKLFCWIFMYEWTVCLLRWWCRIASFIHFVLMFKLCFIWVFVIFVVGDLGCKLPSSKFLALCIVAGLCMKIWVSFDPNESCNQPMWRELNLHSQYILALRVNLALIVEQTFSSLHILSFHLQILLLLLFNPSIITRISTFLFNILICRFLREERRRKKKTEREFTV